MKIILEEIFQPNDGFAKNIEEVKNKLFTYIMVKSGFDSVVSEKVFLDTVTLAQKEFRAFDEKKTSFIKWIFRLSQNFSMDTEMKSDKFSLSSELFGLDKDSKAISAALTHMKQSERELISLRYFQEFGYDEISFITGKKEGAIRTALSRALTRYSRLIKKAS